MGPQAPPDVSAYRQSYGKKAITNGVPTAVVYCEGNFGQVDGKTANGLVRHSQAYRILAVIDGLLEGRDSGQVLDKVSNGIPILEDLEAAVTREAYIPDTLIYGMAPSTGKMSPADRGVVLDAIALGMNIVSGLHEFLGDDPEISGAANASNVTIRDIRKPRPSKDMRLFDGSVSKVKAIRIAVLGTDCAIGKRTTATILARELNARGIKTVLVGTGQTGLMQGAKYGVAMDAVPPQFCCGELERAIVAASHGDDPDVILIEGQGALSHPAFCTSAFILRGSQPHGVVLQHAPKRAHRCDFPAMPMPRPKSEIALIEAFADTRVIGITLNHEAMTGTEVIRAIDSLSRDLGIPVTDALTRPEVHLSDMVLAAFPQLRPVPLAAAE
ncbi:EBNA-1 nuclear protein [Pseudaestuariivita atlantica]|uniref:EBNA-1 nuclear protein n=2 Tax=Pseudaestuariivita atlantica TaxID=1317121 RepID=A0A0L1JJP4_9RHOB|nr:EBNA-1 nuclear protein [Pseudaestuariivita atlantica]